MSREFAAELAACADAAGVRVDAQASRQLEAYYALLRRWNGKISLTSLPLDGFPSASLNRLLIEPAIAAECIPQGQVQLLDIGSGGGSPAIPLKVLRPDMSLTMSESRQKKVVFLREAVSSLGLSGVEVLEGRLEDHAWTHQFACVTLRAVRVDASLAAAIRAALAPNGRLLLFGTPGPEAELRLREVERRRLPGGSTLLVLSQKS